ncbi:hypothetical protein [Streptomyces chengbuensis]|uniref:LexA family protein n=1 Tax=Streptomyces TaxID=1883 RepID=UPI0033A52DB3
MTAGGRPRERDQREGAPDPSLHPRVDRGCSESPTVLEISRAVGLSSTGSTAYQLGKLQQRGLICRDRGWRSIRLC